MPYRCPACQHPVRTLCGAHQGPMCLGVGALPSSPAAERQPELHEHGGAHSLAGLLRLLPLRIMLPAGRSVIDRLPDTQTQRTQPARAAAAGKHAVCSGAWSKLMSLLSMLG